jgi:hypothetical protein
VVNRVVDIANTVSKARMFGVMKEVLMERKIIIRGHLEIIVRTYHHMPFPATTLTKDICL